MEDSSFPYIILKWAQTADGFMARSDFSSKWISTEESRKLAHTWRRDVDGIVVGANTVFYDDPELTVRYELLGERPPPARIVIDRKLALGSQYKIFDEQAPTIVMNTQKSETRGDKLRLVKYDGTLPDCFKLLRSLGLGTLLVEGGATILWALIVKDLWDEARVFVSPTRFNEGLKAPSLPASPERQESLGVDTLYVYKRNPNAPVAST